VSSGATGERVQTLQAVVVVGEFVFLTPLLPGKTLRVEVAEPPTRLCFADGVWIPFRGRAFLLGFLCRQNTLCVKGCGLP